MGVIEWARLRRELLVALTQQVQRQGQILEAVRGTFDKEACIGKQGDGRAGAGIAAEQLQASSELTLRAQARAEFPGIGVNEPLLAGESLQHIQPDTPQLCPKAH